MNKCRKCQARVYLGVGHDPMECLEKQYRKLLLRCHTGERKIKEWIRWAEINDLQRTPK